MIFSLYLTLVFLILNANPNLETFGRFIDVDKVAVTEEPPLNCESLSQELIEEIQNYKPIANLIIEAVTTGDFKGKVYKATSNFVDKFGPRLAGSQVLEDGIDHILRIMETGGMSNVRGEEAMVPHWVRGKEKATVLLPRSKDLHILGLGGSIGTDATGINGTAIVVRSFEDLQANADKIPGKIVVYNADFVSYAQSNPYRWNGASEAAKLGAIAALIRSVTPFSLDTPHTGMQRYEEGVTQIPVACITVEDAEYLWRVSQYEEIEIHLEMEAKNEPDAMSRNGIGEWPGGELKDEIVIVSGHIDSWDVGQGAVDDGAASVVAVETLFLFQHLSLVPKRTVTAVLWTAEETGLQGASAYVEQHRDELHKIIAAFESDSGTFKPQGIDFAGSEEAACIIKEITEQLLAPINATTFRKFPIVGTDISFLEGVPNLSLNSERFDNSEYFYYHHSPADTMTILDPDELDLCLAVAAITTYVVADMKNPLPRVSVK